MSAWGIGGNVVVDNKGTAAITAKVTLAASGASGEAYVLTAPSLTSKAVTIGGSTVGADGAFAPVAKAVVVHGREMTVSVPAGSAVVVVVR